MATTPLGGFADMSYYQRQLANQAAKNDATSPLDSLIQGFQTGQAIRNLPETMAQNQLAQQVKQALLQAQLNEATQGKLMEVGGSLVRVQPNGQVQTLFTDPKRAAADRLQALGLTPPNEQGIVSGVTFDPSKGAFAVQPLPSGVTSINKIGTAPGGAGSTLNPETTDLLANRFILTGEIPGMGMGKAATEARSAVLNRVSEIMKGSTTTPEDQLVKQAAYKASKGELSKLQGQRGLITAFSNTANSNLDMALQLSDKVDRTTNVPVFDRWILAGKQSIAGDPDVAAFDAATRVAVNEAARVITTATGGGVTSDAARAEVNAILNTAQTADQFRAVADILKKDIANRSSGYDQQIKQIHSDITGLGGLNNKAPSTPISSPSGGMIKVINPNGQIGSIPQSKLSDALKAGFKQVQ